MPAVEQTVKGLSQLGEALKQLPKDIREKAVRIAARDAGRIIQSDAQAHAPHKTGEYARGIRVTVKTYNTAVIAKVTTSGKHGYLGNWLEYGTAAHEIVAKTPNGVLSWMRGVAAHSVHHPGDKPKPHMRPALDNNVDRVTKVFAEALRKYLTKQGIDIASGGDA